jgi:hypothetical protein
MSKEASHAALSNAASHAAAADAHIFGSICFVWK